MKSRAIGILVMVVIAADGGTRYDLGDGDFVIEPGN